MKYIIVFLISIVLLVGCAEVKTKNDTVLGEDYHTIIRPAKKSKKLKIGMKRSEVKYIMGVPDKKREDLNLYGAYEQWIYKPLKHAEKRSWWVYLFFENNKLIKIKRPTNF